MTNISGLKDAFSKYFSEVLGDEWILWNVAGRSLTWGDEVVYTPLGESFSQSTSDIVPLGEYLALREREREYLALVMSQLVKDLEEKHGSLDTPRG